MALGLEAELLEVAAGALLQSRHPVGLRVARTDTRQEQQVAHAAGVGVEPYGLWRLGGVDAGVFMLHLSLTLFEKCSLIVCFPPPTPASGGEKSISPAGGGRGVENNV